MPSRRNSGTWEDYPDVLDGPGCCDGASRVCILAESDGVISNTMCTLLDLRCGTAKPLFCRRRPTSSPPRSDPGHPSSAATIPFRLSWPPARDCRANDMQWLD